MSYIFSITIFGDKMNVEFKGSPQDLAVFLNNIVGTIISVTKTKSAGSYLIVYS